MSDKYEILAQNCLALAIHRCETAGLPLTVKRQRMVIKGAIRQMLEEEGAVEGLKAAKLLEGLTPGGSEFAGDPEACARWVRERLSSTGRLAAERNELREQVEELTEALSIIYRDITAKNFARYTFGEYREGALLGDLAVEKARVALAKWEEEQPGYAETQYQAHVDL